MLLLILCVKNQSAFFFPFLLQMLQGLLSPVMLQVLIFFFFFGKSVVLQYLCSKSSGGFALFFE